MTKVKTKTQVSKTISRPVNLRDRHQFPLFIEVSTTVIKPNTLLLLEIISKEANSTVINAIDQLGYNVQLDLQFKNAKQANHTLTSIKPGVVVAIREAVREPMSVSIGLLSGIIMPAATAGEIIVDEMENLEILPCSLDVLMNLSDSLQLRNDPLHHQAICQTCSSATSQCCAKCGTLFCNKKCQGEAWKTHMDECKSLQMILQWSLASKKTK